MKNIVVGTLAFSVLFSAANITGQTAAQSDRQAQPLDAKVLSDTQGVDFGPYLRQAIQMIGKSWSPRGDATSKTAIRFTISPDGTVHSMVLVGSSGLVEVDRAAWGSITSLGRLPALPAQFAGPNLVLEIDFNAH
jgi:TonB family protein